MTAAGNRQLERYDLLERIAVGGMAEVFLAKAYGAHGFEKTVAIKRILPDLARTGEFEERFIDEAKLAVGLSHANIVQVLDFGRDDDTLFLVLEYVDGIDLAALLARYRSRGQTVPLPAAFHIAIELARGLDYAHQRGVVHRDVSPSNILLSRAGDVKIADFGIAVPDARGLRQPSQRRRIMGKWRYMSPEQTRGEEVGTRSDLFAAGAVLFELFTGDKLFPGDEPEQIMANIHDMDIPSASSRRPGLPEAFDDLLRCTLERIPERRPARASTLQRTLAELSYASSIVATALDVAEAIERVIVPTDTPLPERAEPEQGPARALDDVIRAQLGPVDNGTRVTATAELEELPPRPLTIVRTGVGGDGLDQWRLDAGGDDGPTGSAGAGQAEADPGDRGVIAPGDRGALAASSRRSGLRLGAVAMGGVAVAAVSWLVLAPGGGPAAAEVADAGLALAVPADAAPPRQPVLVVTVQPEDAELWVDGVQIPGASPFEHPLMAEQSHTVELRREGYQSHRREMTLFEGELRRTLDVSLAPMRIQLMVSSTPPGAEVLLDGRALGRTPLVRDLDAAELALLREHPLVLERRGYRSESVTGLTPLPGQPIRVERTLEPVPRAQPTGKVRVHMDGTWAYAYLRGKRVGQVPGELELPAGRHQLRLVNPISEVEWALSVEVKAGQTIYRRVAAEP